MSDPFAPPEDAPSTGGATGVIAGWMVAFGALGAALGAFLVMADVAENLATIAIPMAGIGAVAGLLAHRVEGQRAAKRTAVVDSRGRSIRPLGTWLTALPLAVGALSLMALVIVGSLYSQSRGVGVGFLLLSLGLGALFRPLYASNRLRRAVESASRGERADAALEQVATAWWSTASTRAQAALNLGLLALRRGELERAGQWYAMVQSGRAVGFASTGLALVYVASERFDEAEGALREAAVSAAGRHVQGELDGVRLLLVLRRDGAEDALELGGRLAPASPGALFVGALAVAHLDLGQHDEAMTLLDTGAEAIRGSGLAYLLPELPLG